MKHGSETKSKWNTDAFFDKILIILGLRKKKKHHRHHYTLFKPTVQASASPTETQTNKRNRHRNRSFWDFLFKKQKINIRTPKYQTASLEKPTPSSYHTKTMRSKEDWWGDFLGLFKSKRSKEKKSARIVIGMEPQSEHRRHHKKKKKKLREWFRKYIRVIKEPFYNFLYFLNLRSAPYDPFLDHDRFTYEDTQIMRIQRYIVYAFNSIILYIIAYISAYLIYQLAVILMASFFGIDSVLYYNEVMFPIGNASPKWNQWNIITITLSGPLVSLLGGILWFRVMMRRAQHPIMRLFYLWLSFHSFNLFFGAFVAGVITDQGFGYVANWLYMGIPLKMLFSLIALGFMAYIGWRSARHVLATSNSPQRINRKNRPYFILNQTILPWLIGSTIMLWIKIPNRMPQHENIIVYDSIILGAMAFLSIAPLFNWKAKPFESKLSTSRKKTGFVWAYLLAAFFLILLYRFGLERGLHFIIKISFSISLYR